MALAKPDSNEVTSVSTLTDASPDFSGMAKQNVASHIRLINDRLDHEAAIVGLMR